jgi:hypothetical protein
MQNGSFDFVQEANNDQPPRSPPKVLHVANALPVHELRQALAKKEFQKNSDSRWPTAALRKSHGSAQLRPVEIDDQSTTLSQRRVLALEKSMLIECQKLSDHDADVLDALSALYLQRARSPTDDVQASINELLELRGLKPRLSGQKRRGGFSSKQRDSIKQALAHLEDVWLTFPDRRFSHRKVADVVQTRCFMLTERKGQLFTDGSLDFREFSFRPGLIYSSFLFGPWRQVALLAAKALQYDPVQEVWEKRVARYLSWQWRIRANTRGYFKPLGVSTLLDVVGVSVPGRSARTRDRFERCLDHLRKDRVIAQWQYHGFPGLLGETKGWKNDWTGANILVEPPDLIKDSYFGIGKHKAPAASREEAWGDRIRGERQTRGITILHASEELKIPPLELDLIESGRKRPSMTELKLLQTWLAA